MKNLKPSQILFMGSFAATIMTAVSLIILYQLGFLINGWLVFVVPFLVGTICYITFYILLKKYVTERLRVLYRNIQTRKITPENQANFSLNDDVIGQAEEETQNWSEEKQAEINSLREQAAYRKEFLGNVAHELKTPIFSIQGYILTLLEGGLEDEKVNRTFLERASKATERMVNIVQDLDQIAKLEVNELSLHKTIFCINDLVTEVFESLELQAKEKGIKLAFAKSFPFYEVHADRSKISQVLTNLVANSIFYGNPNGETLVRFYEMEDYLSVEVADNGPGIHTEDLPRLFERFYRVEKSRNRHDGGSGLGLAIAKHIIESHGHRIAVRSTVGVGSTFSFSLDLVE